MRIIYFYAVAGAVAVSLFSLIGIITLALQKEKARKKITLFLVSLSAGTLLGESFIHLMPEAVDKTGADMSVWFWLLGGIMMFFVLEKIIFWHHCHNPESHKHIHPIGKMTIIGDGLHNFIDGLIVAGAFLANIPLGIATVITVIAHEIPQKISDFSILLYAGYSKAKALLFNFISALIAIVGAAAGLAINARIESFSVYILPFAAGGFIYIATADIIPELRKETNFKKSIKQLLNILLGIGVMLSLKIFLK